VTQEKEDTQSIFSRRVRVVNRINVLV